MRRRLEHAMHEQNDLVDLLSSSNEVILSLLPVVQQQLARPLLELACHTMGSTAPVLSFAAASLASALLLNDPVAVELRTGSGKPLPRVMTAEVDRRCYSDRTIQSSMSATITNNVELRAKFCKHRLLVDRWVELLTVGNVLGLRLRLQLMLTPADKLPCPLSKIEEWIVQARLTAPIFQFKDPNKVTKDDLPRLEASCCMIADDDHQQQHADQKHDQQQQQVESPCRSCASEGGSSYGSSSNSNSPPASPKSCSAPSAAATAGSDSSSATPNTAGQHLNAAASRGPTAAAAAAGMQASQPAKGLWLRRVVGGVKAGVASLVSGCVVAVKKVAAVLARWL